VTQVKLHKVPRRWPLVLIALDKFVKALALTAISMILTHWRDPVNQWLDDTIAEPHSWLVDRVLDGLKHAMGVGEHRLAQVMVIIFIGLYLIEGVGLLYGKKWAEWMVVIGTVLFLPIEIWQFAHRPRWSMVFVFIINIFVASYLLWRMHREKVVKHERELTSIPVEPAPTPSPKQPQN